MGKILSAEAFPEAQQDAYKLLVDFSAEIGTKKSSAQITGLYSIEELPGKECLVISFHDKDGHVALCVPEKEVPLGTKLL